ncbi:hypothetical protein COB57_05570 [Candidatus Peregrinibacteria bacterium]|nr:MAG: hypothetical protein COB57_05570 [Candidatus Peregrinibacteria bacterium]
MLQKKHFSKLLELMGASKSEQDEAKIPVKNPGKYSREFLEKAKRYVPIMKYIPGIRAVFLCNTVSFGIAKETSDIDIFVVTDDKTLWLTRLILTLVLHVLGVRRHGDTVSGRFCLSFFATELGAYNIQSLERKILEDPYLAVWTSSLKVLFAEAGFLKKFQKKNEWIQKYNLQFSDRVSSTSSLLFAKISGKILCFLGGEFVAKHILSRRTLAKYKKLEDTSGTVINDTYLKFHNKDIRHHVFQELSKIAKFR